MSKFQQLMELSPQWRKIFLIRCVILGAFIFFAQATPLESLIFCSIFSIVNFVIFTGMRFKEREWIEKVGPLTHEKVIARGLSTISWIILAWMCIVIEAFQQASG